MISLTAIALALAFWTPYNGGQPIPCTAANVHPVPVQATPDGRPADGYAYRGVGGCDIYIYVGVGDYPIDLQCSILAHEWGHAFFDLDESNDPNNVMTQSYIIPRACQTGSRRAVRQRRAAESRTDTTRSHWAKRRSRHRRAQRHRPDPAPSTT